MVLIAKRNRRDNMYKQAVLFCSVLFCSVLFCARLVSCDYPRKDDTESSIDGPASPVDFPSWPGLGHRLGWAIDIGDVDLNGYNDIVVGAPGWNGDMGAIEIVLNHPTDGLVVGFQITTQMLEDKFPHVDFDPGDEFGYSVVISGGDEDGRPAIFVGAPGRGSDCGSVYKLMGRVSTDPGGYDVDEFEIQYIYEKPSGYCWGALAERFGSAMTTTDRHAVMLVGAPAHELVADEAGAVYLMDKFHPADPIQGPYSIEDVTSGLETVRGFQRFGWSMDATVEIPDIDPEVIAFAIGAMGKYSKPNRRQGKAVAVLYDTSSHDWLEPIVLDEPWPTARGGMGFDVAFGHLDCYMGNIDLAVTDPYMWFDGGMVFTFYNLWVHPPPWATFSHWTFIDESSPGAFEYKDHFGWSVAAGRLDPGDLWDLVVGAPDDALGGDPDNAGLAFYMFGNPDPWAFATDGIYSSRSLWTPGGDDRFGLETALGDLNGDTIDDVAVGAPGWEDKGRFAIFLSGARPAGGPLTGLWEGTIEDSRCPPDEPSEISLYLYQAPDDPDGLEGWGWLGTYFEIYLNPSGSDYDGCYGLYPSMCDAAMFVLGDSEVLDPDKSEFIIWVEPAIDLGGIDFRMPLHFTEEEPGRWHGVCEPHEAACGFFGIDVDLWIRHVGTSYASYADMCAEDCP
jgi:hypothetical protein